LFWDKFASDYDDHQLNDNYKILIERIVGDAGKTEKVLDAACGTAIVSFALSKNVNYVEAADYSAEMIAVAKEKLVANNITNVNFTVQNACELNFPDQYFDVVVICNSLHVIEEPEKALLESKRVLKKEGLLIAPNACLGESEETKRQAKEMIPKGFLAYHLYSPDSYCDMIKNSGFRVLIREPMAYRMPMEYVVAQKGQN